MQATTARQLPPRLRSYGISAGDLAAATTAALRETRNDIAAAIKRAEQQPSSGSDTLAIHRHNLDVVDIELARRAPTGYRHSPDGCGVCATMPAYLVARHNH